MADTERIEELEAKAYFKGLSKEEEDELAELIEEKRTDDMYICDYCAEAVTRPHACRYSPLWKDSER